MKTKNNAESKAANLQSEKENLVVTQNGELKTETIAVSVEARIEKVRRLASLASQRDNLNLELQDLENWKNADPTTKCTLEIKGITPFVTTNSSLIQKAMGYVIELYQDKIERINQAIVTEQL